MAPGFQQDSCCTVHCSSVKLERIVLLLHTVNKMT